MRIEAPDNTGSSYKLVFERQSEVEVLRTAFIEYVCRLEAEGRADLITGFDRKISDLPRRDSIARHAINTSRPEFIVAKLRDLHDNTETAVEEMLFRSYEIDDPVEYEMQMAGVEWRRNLGDRALSIVRVSELKLTEHVVDDMDMVMTDMDAEFAPLLGDNRQS